MADNYGQWYVTKMFTDAEAAAAASSNKITFLRMIASTDVFAQEDLATMTNNTISTVKAAQTALIAGVIPANGTYKVQGVFTNTGVTDDYLMNTILLVASYNGSEFLAAAQVAKQPFKMPAAGTTEQTVYTIGAQIVVSNTATVNLTLDPKALVTNESLKIITDAQAVKDAAQDEATKTLSDKVPLFATLADAQTFAGIKTFTEKIIGSITGTAEKAVALVTSRKLKVKLDSTTDKTFNGTADVTDIGVSGVLQIANGGTGRSDGTVLALTNTLLPAGADLDTYTTSGQFFSGISTTITNFPPDASGTYFTLNVVANSTNTCSQTYTSMLANRIWSRTYSGTVPKWSKWIETTNNAPLTVIASGTDLNTVTGIGQYCNSTAASGITNMPDGSSNYFILEVLSTSDVTVMQRYWDISNKTTFTRGLSALASKWTDWEEIGKGENTYNLLPNSSWNLGIGNWRENTVTNPSYEIIAPASDKPTSNILHSKPTTSSVQQLSQRQHPVFVKAGETLTLSFDYKDKNWTRNGKIVTLRVFPSPNTPNSSANSIWGTNINKNLNVNVDTSTFTRITYTFTPTVDGYLDVIPYDDDDTGNHEAWYREMMLIFGKANVMPEKWYANPNDTVLSQALAPDGVKIQSLATGGMMIAAQGVADNTLELMGVIEKATAGSPDTSATLRCIVKIDALNNNVRIIAFDDTNARIYVGVAAATFSGIYVGITTAPNWQEVGKAPITPIQITSAFFDTGKLVYFERNGSVFINIVAQSTTKDIAANSSQTVGTVATKYAFSISNMTEWQLTGVAFSGSGTNTPIIINVGMQGASIVLKSSLAIPKGSTIKISGSYPI